MKIDDQACRSEAIDMKLPQLYLGLLRLDLQQHMSASRSRLRVMNSRAPIRSLPHDRCAVACPRNHKQNEGRKRGRAPVGYEKLSGKRLSGIKVYARLNRQLRPHKKSKCCQCDYWPNDAPCELPCTPYLACSLHHF